jgi:2-succinyl-5-enolpyruvyl-6-hydroxy-3-cyclohexene-1-carboxylate synthase
VSLPDLILEAGAKAVDKHLDGWLDKALVKAREAAEKRAAELDALEQPTRMDELERDALDFVPEGLAAIERRSPALVRWGKYKSTAVLLALSSGDADKAKLLAMASGLTTEEYLAISDSSSLRMGEITRQRQKDADEVVALVKEIGLGALRFSIPLLLAAL